MTDTRLQLAELSKRVAIVSYFGLGQIDRQPTHLFSSWNGAKEPGLAFFDAVKPSLASAPLPIFFAEADRAGFEEVSPKRPTIADIVKEMPNPALDQDAFINWTEQLTSSPIGAHIIERLVLESDAFRNWSKHYESNDAFNIPKVLADYLANTLSRPEEGEEKDPAQAEDEKSSRVLHEFRDDVVVSCVEQVQPDDDTYETTVVAPEDIQAHWKAGYELAMKYTHHHHDAGAVVSDAWFKVYPRKNLKDPRFKGYFLQSVRHCALDIYPGAETARQAIA